MVAGGPACDAQPGQNMLAKHMNTPMLSVAYITIDKYKAQIRNNANSYFVTAADGRKEAPWEAEKSELIIDWKT